MVELTEEDRDAVAAGRMTLTELAAARGVTKQAISARFQRLGWSGRPIEPRPKARAKAKPARAARKPARARTAGPATTDAHDSDNLAPAASQAPAAPIFCVWPDPDDDDGQADHAQMARHRTLNALTLAIIQGEAILSGPQLGPSALKATTQAVLLAHAKIEELTGQHATGAPTMTIKVMDERRTQEVRDQAEADFRGEFPELAPEADDGDDLADGADTPEPLEPGQDEHEPAPGTILTANGNDAPRLPQAPPAANVASLAARLHSAHTNGQVGRFQLQTFATALGLGKSREAEQLMRMLIDAATCDIAAYQHIDHELRRQLKALSSV